jgi:hypothetical protein
VNVPRPSRRPRVTTEQRRAFAFLARRAGTREPFTLADLATDTGWSESTAKTYIDKQFRDYLRRVPEGFQVKREFSRARPFAPDVAGWCERST